MKIRKKDTDLGKQAVREGLITAEQLAEALRTLEASSGSPGQPRSLAGVLVAKGFLTRAQATRLSRPAKGTILARKTDRERKKGVDFLFGQLLVRDNKATQNQVNKCLEIQEKALKEGKPVPRLGELLVEQGFVDADTIQSILRLQNKEILICSSCGSQFNVIGAERGISYRCRTCGGVMSPRTFLDSLDTRDSEEEE